MSSQALLNFKHKRRLPFLQIKVISLIDFNPLVTQERSKTSVSLSGLQKESVNIKKHLKRGKKVQEDVRNFVGLVIGFFARRVVFFGKV